MRDYLPASQISESQNGLSTWKIFPTRIISGCLTTQSNSWRRMRKGHGSIPALHWLRKQHKMHGKQWLWAASSQVPPSTRNMYIWPETHLHHNHRVNTYEILLGRNEQKIREERKTFCKFWTRKTRHALQKGPALSSVETLPGRRLEPSAKSCWYPRYTNCTCAHTKMGQHCWSQELRTKTFMWPRATQHIPRTSESWGKGRKQKQLLKSTTLPRKQNHPAPAVDVRLSKRQPQTQCHFGSQASPCASPALPRSQAEPP